jgi:hypothetical protein
MRFRHVSLLTLFKCFDGLRKITVQSRLFRSKFPINSVQGLGEYLMRALSRFAFLFTIAFVMLIAFSSEKTAFAQAEDDVVINEFSVNPNVGKEYVELLVTNASGVNMQGWTLSDTSTRVVAAGATEGDVTLPAAAYLANVPQGTHVVIVFTTPSTNTNILPEDTSTVDGNNKLVLIVGTTTGITTSGTIDNATADNLQLYAGTRAAGTLIDEVLVGANTSYITGATWGDNNGVTTTDNINGSTSMPSNSIARFVPTANTLAGFQDNDTGARWVVETNSYGTPGIRNAGVISESAVGGSSAPHPKTADFDGDLKADVSIWSPNSGNWIYIKSSNSTQPPPFPWGSGALGDILVPGDYDGDGKTDFAVWRPSDGNWYVIKSSDGSGFATGWGTSTDTPVPADYDGDGKTDIAVFRASEGNWYIINSSNATVTTRGWGTSTDKPVPGDYDGDRKADIAVFRPSEGNWYIINSLTNTSTVRAWGTSSDKLVPADYDGDGITDLAVFRPSEGNWYIRNSGSGLVVQGWGTSGDFLVPADYNGDGKADIAVWRPSEGNWYILNSGGTPTPVTQTYLGNFGDLPIPATYPPSQQPPPIFIN